MSELSELKDFRRKLVKARNLIANGFRLFGPLAIAFDTQGMGYPNGVYTIEFGGKQMSRDRFLMWASYAIPQDYRLMYANSVAALDARIAKLQEGK